MGWSAFSGCTALQKIVILKGVKKIGEGAFRGCTSLTTLTLPSGVNKIHEDEFKGCSALTTIYVPAKKADYYMDRLDAVLHNKIVELAPEKKTKAKE